MEVSFKVQQMAIGVVNVGVADSIHVVNLVWGVSPRPIVRMLVTRRMT